MMLHNNMLDPLWKTADECDEYRPENKKAREKIRRRARGRVYAFLAHRLGIHPDDCHTAHFDLGRCRAAWRALQGITYSEIRAWAHEQQKEAA